MLDSVYTVVLQKNRIYPHFGVFIGRDIPSGLYVVTIEPNSPAAQANIQPGDRVLAINGKLVSSFIENPTDIIYRLAHQTERLTLSLTRANTINFVGLFPRHSPSEYIPQENGYPSYDIDHYIKSILQENPHRYEHIRPTDNHVQHSRPRRKRRSVKTIETQTSFANLIPELDDTPPRQRSIPSMGTSHMILRNFQSNIKDNSPSSSPEAKSPADFPMRITPPKQRISSPVELANLPVFPRENPPSIPETVTVSSMSDDDDGLREVRLIRTPNFLGFGFHLQYNRIFFMIHHVEPNSPAEIGGLRGQDVIRRINNEPTDQLSHKTFLEIINANLEVILLVQPYDKFLRDNPQALNPPPPPLSMPPARKKENSTNRNPLFRAFSKLKQR